MIDINLIRTKPDWVAEQLAKRGVEVNFTKLLKLDEQKRKLQTLTEQKKAERNRVSTEIAQIKKAGGDVSMLVKAMQMLGEEIGKLGDERIAKFEKDIFNILAALPNIPLPCVQAGGKEENRVVKNFGQIPKFNFKPKDHVELCTSLGLIDYERGAKISGAGTWVYTGLGAQLEWALLNYFIDFHIKNGYTFILPPYLLNWESGYAAGQFPKFQDDVFCTSVGSRDALTEGKSAINPQLRFLLPTAESALINMHRNEIIPADALPIKYAGYSACFRNEAAGYGSKERGMIRGYQFNKIEMFIYCIAQDSPKFFDELVRNAEKLVEGLGLHFQTVALAAGDLGPVMAKTFDIEVYIPSMGGYKEVSSCSNAVDYQARRANIKTKAHVCDERGCRIVNEFVHTLNASGLATSRLIPAIVEQFQQADGSVVLPEILHRHMHGTKVLLKHCK